VGGGQRRLGTLDRRQLTSVYNGWTTSDEDSGARTNLKVGNGHTFGKNYLSCPSTFLALQVQLVVLVSAFVQFAQFLVCCSTHGVRAQTFVKVESAPVNEDNAEPSVFEPRI